MSESGPSLGNSETILRTFDNKYRRSDGTIRHDAFKIRDNGKDNDGLSVSRQAEREIADIELLFDLKSQNKMLCYLLPVDVRAIEFEALDGGLDVIAAPTLNDPSHALIIGDPIFYGEKALRRRVADVLSNLARYCDAENPPRP